MGLFNFIKNAGAKVFGSGKETKHETAKVTGDKDNEERQENLKAASKLEETIRDLKLEVEGLRVEIEGEMATVQGRAKDQSTREKVVLVVGNVEGISQVDDKMSVENKEPESVFHTVETGDTLSKIAKEHYGNANKYQEIFEANKPMLKDPDKIYPGQVLRILTQTK
ncbi:peptidoglycan-binding protein LysM [Antarcticibacterium sp. 1MA-6-2]|uniref:peptidoglycan-binding protein LysM n=1 Tax=Antarcticibacterium sp. 1MA-6-2 TaxID=2908210 RepID=UPI001F4060AB|nr:peptidoglycan-binding protein LysM [Antarcticibacterium sp. 1MA-6-2]UJH90275.1 peptidoglycan-binding protein LysM [Antarcticibacterium sp. 1MA-6-2]